MKHTLGLLAGLWLAATTSCFSAEWKDLFDGSSLDGWKAQTDANWRVEGGAIVADKGREGLLTSTSTYSDYEIEVTFRAKGDTHSGVYLSTSKTVTDPGTQCYALSIAPSSDPYPTGSLGGRVRNNSGDYGSWQTYKAKVEGAKVTVWLDGKLVVEYDDRHPIRSGNIGLEFDRGRVEFKKIRIKNLGMP